MAEPFWFGIGKVNGFIIHMIKSMLCEVREDQVNGSQGGDNGVNNMITYREFRKLD